MIERIDSHAIAAQNRLRRDTMLYNLSIWLLDVVPPGVVNTTDPVALFKLLREEVDRLVAQLPLTDFKLMGQYAAALVCLGADFETAYPSASTVLRSKYLSQSERADWFEQFLLSFPYLKGPRFEVPVPDHPLPPELWHNASARKS